MPHLSNAQRRDNERAHEAWWAATTDVPYGYCHCGCGQQTPLAPRTNFSRYWVKDKPRPYVDSAHANRPQRQRQLSRYRVEDHGYTTACWVWTGNIYSTGYGRLKYRGEAYSAHRFFYESYHGQIPEGFHLHHLCENTLCVRVSHMTPLAPAPHVHLRSTTKMTWAKVNDIRLLHAVGGFRHKDLAEHFGVSRELISQILRNKIWRANT